MVAAARGAVIATLTARASGLARFIEGLLFTSAIRRAALAAGSSAKDCRRPESKEGSV